MSLINILRKKIKVDLFTTPSHAQKLFIFPKFRQFYKYDISETDAYNPQEALDLAQKKAAKIYKTKSTYFLTNGSTSGVIAATLACTNNEDNVLIWDKAHPSHHNAVKLAGAEPVYFSLAKNESWGIYEKTAPDLIENKFKNNKIKAVIITSPTYEGVVSDIKSISEICHKYGAYLIVDEAHGALFPFCDKLPESAIYQGADFIIQSLHKTAGGLNPTALLHCNADAPLTPNPSPPRGEGNEDAISYKCAPAQSRSQVQIALDSITTTSPSYPLLASIEKNINFLNSQKGRKMIFELVENIETLMKNVKTCEFYHNENSGGDLTKVLIKSQIMLPRHSEEGINVNPNLIHSPLTQGERGEFQREERAREIRVRGTSGPALSEFLYQNGIEDEKTNEKSTMLLCGLGTDIKKLQKLERILKKA